MSEISVFTPNGWLPCITMQGIAHYRNNNNNQDRGYQCQDKIIICDGCSSSKYSEAGAIEVLQMLISTKELNVNNFEEMVKKVFDTLIEQKREWFGKQLTDYIMSNMLFTIVAAFKTENEFVVKVFGDGYIATKNLYGAVSYLKLYYGGAPPYFAYKYIPELEDEYEEKSFKTFVFPYENYSGIMVATDGMAPIAVDSKFRKLDKQFFAGGSLSKVESILKANNSSFGDDVTFGVLTTIDSENVKIEESFGEILREILKLDCTTDDTESDIVSDKDIPKTTTNVTEGTETVIAEEEVKTDVSV